MIKFGIVSLFPQLFDCLNYSIPGRALKQQLATIQLWNPQDFATDKHRTVDDKPYGGGPGMLMKVEPLRHAINAAKTALPNASTIYLSPQGKPFNQKTAQNWATTRSEIIFVAGRYEGIDERLLNSDIDEEWSIGDFVLSGGELAAAAVIDALLRLRPQVLGDAQSATQDSFSDGLLDYPHYTRPKDIDGEGVPEVLLRGNHAQIALWRQKQALGCTWLKRPELLEKIKLTAQQQALLEVFISEQQTNK